MTNETDRADALVERIFGAALGTMDLLAIYLGDRLGYYRALAGDGGLTAGELAERVGADERYTREWLEHQAVGGFIEVDGGTDADGRRYRLTPGHDEVFLDRDSLRYLAPLARMLTSAATRMPEIVGAYRSGGGVPWDAYGPDMREAQGDINRPLFLHELGGQLAAVSTLKARLEAGDARLADVGCGVGWAAIGLATAFPGLRVDGFDPDEPSIELARTNAAERGVADRVAFHAIDAAAAGGGEPYDLVLACECVHDLSDPVAVLASMRRLAGETGEVVVIDERVAEAFGAPGDEIERLMYGYSILVCLLDGRSRTPSRATGTVMRPDMLRGYAREAGFRDVEVLPIEHDTFRYYRLVI